jgi:hypothetical protein
MRQQAKSSNGRSSSSSSGGGGRVGRILINMNTVRMVVVDDVLVNVR